MKKLKIALYILIPLTVGTTVVTVATMTNADDEVSEGTAKTSSHVKKVDTPQVDENIPKEVIDEEAPVTVPVPQEVNQNVVAQEPPQRTLADMTGHEIMEASSHLHEQMPHQLDCAAELLNFPLYRQRMMNQFDNNATLALGHASNQVINNKIEWIKAGYTCSYYPSWRI